MSELIILSDDQAKEFPEIVETYTPIKEAIVSKLALAKELISQHNEDRYNAEIWADARKIRLAIRKDRIALDKERKELKEMAKRYADAVDGPAREMRKVCESQEEALQKIENFEAEQEAKRKRELEIERKAMIEQLGADPDNYPDLAGYEDIAFDALLAGIEFQLLKQAEEEAKAKKEAEEAEAKRQAEIAEARKLAEVAEAKRKLSSERMSQLNTVKGYYDGDLSEVTEEEFETIFDQAKQAFEQAEAERAEITRIKAEQEAEAEAKRQAEIAEAKAKAEEEEAKKSEAYQRDRKRLKSALSKLGEVLKAFSEYNRDQLETDQARIEFDYIGDKLESMYRHYD